MFGVWWEGWRMLVWNQKLYVSFPSLPFINCMSKVFTSLLRRLMKKMREEVVSPTSQDCHRDEDTTHECAQHSEQSRCSVNTSLNQRTKKCLFVTSYWSFSPFSIFFMRFKTLLKSFCSLLATLVLLSVSLFPVNSWCTYYWEVWFLQPNSPSRWVERQLGISINTNKTSLAGLDTFP